MHAALKVDTRGPSSSAHWSHRSELTPGAPAAALSAATARGSTNTMAYMTMPQQLQQQQHPLQSPPPHHRSFNTYDPLASLHHHHHHPLHHQNALASDQELLSDFCSFLEHCVLTKNIELLRRIVLEYLVHQELTLVHFKRFGANLIAILPFAVADAHKHAIAVQLLHKPRASTSGTCARVFAFLAARVATKNLATLERVFLDFCNRSDAELAAFVKLGTQAVSIIPCDPVQPVVPVFAPPAYSRSDLPPYCTSPYQHHALHAHSPQYGPPPPQQQPPPPQQSQQPPQPKQSEPSDATATAPGVTPTHERAKRMVSSQSKLSGLSDRAPIARRRAPAAPVARASGKRRAVRTAAKRELQDSDDDDDVDSLDKRKRRKGAKRRRVRASRSVSFLTSSDATDKSTINSMIDETLRLMYEPTRAQDRDRTGRTGSQSVQTSGTGRKPAVERSSPPTEQQQLKNRIRDAMRVHEAREPWRRVFYKLPLPFDEGQAPDAATKLQAFWRQHGRAVWERNFWPPLDLAASAQRNTRQRLARVAFDAIVLDVYSVFGVEVFAALDAERHPGWWYRRPILDLFAYCRIVGEAKCLAFVKANVHARFPDCGLALPLQHSNSGVLRTQPLDSAAVWSRIEQVAVIVRELNALKRERASSEAQASAAVSGNDSETTTAAPEVETTTEVSVDGATPASLSEDETPQQQPDNHDEPDGQDDPEEQDVAEELEQTIPLALEQEASSADPDAVELESSDERAAANSSHNEAGDAAAGSTGISSVDASITDTLVQSIESTSIGNIDTKDVATRDDDASSADNSSGTTTQAAANGNDDEVKSDGHGEAADDVNGEVESEGSDDEVDAVGVSEDAMGDYGDALDEDNEYDDDEEELLIEAMALAAEKLASETLEAAAVDQPCTAAPLVSAVRPDAPVAPASAPALAPTLTTALAASAAPSLTPCTAAAATAVVAGAAQAAAAAVAGLKKDLAPERFAALMRKINARGLK